MLLLEKIKTSPLFKEIPLKKGEVLFSEGEINNNIYIIYDGEVAITKNTSSHKSESKSLALLGVGNTIGEGSLSHSSPKEVSVLATRNTILLCIDAQKGFEELMKQDLELGINTLKSIIHISNIRLLRSNKQVTANHEIHKAINNLTSLDNASVLGLIDIFAKIISCDACIYLEKNPFINDYVEYKYDSRFPGKLQDTPIEILGKDVQYKEIKQSIELSRYCEIADLSIGKENYGYLILTRDAKIFEEHEQRMLTGICNAFVGVIRQKKIQEEEKNKKYMRGI